MMEDWGMPHRSPMMGSSVNVGLAAGAQKNLARLKQLLGSTPGDQTLPTLDSQQSEATPFHNDLDGLNFSDEIIEINNLLDRFQFISPAAASHHHEGNQNRDLVESFNGPYIHHMSLLKQPPNNTLQTPRSAPPGRLHRGPFMDRSNRDIEGAISNLHEKLMREDPPSPQKEDPQEQIQKARDVQPAVPLQDPEGLLFADDSLHLDNIEEGDELQEMPSVSDNDWEKFHTLTLEVERALDEALHERNSAMQWAKQVHQTTQAWVQNQRMAIEREQAALLKARNSNEEDQNSEDIARYEARIDRLEKSIQGLELDLKTSVHQVIEYQQDNLRKLEEIKGMRGAGGSISPDSNTMAPVWPLSAKHQNIHRVASFGTDREPQLQKKISFADMGTANETSRPSGLGAPPYPTPPAPATPYVQSSAHRNNFRGTTPGSVGLQRNKLRSCGSREQMNGERKVVHFPNGAQEECRSDGSSTLRFPNGDVQITCANGSVAYYHVESRVIQVATTDGSEIYEFPNKQVERHYPDGRKIVQFADGTKKRIFADGTIETRLPGGKYVVVEHLDGTNDVRQL